MKLSKNRINQIVKEDIPHIKKYLENLNRDFSATNTNKSELINAFSEIVILVNDMNKSLTLEYCDED